jgi:gas vesicle protein
MGQDAQELRDDIRRRREDLEGTLDAIGDRVSPGRMIERRRNRMADGVRSARDRVMGSVSDSTHRASDVASGAADTVKEAVSPDAVRAQTAGHPLSAGMVSFGVGFLLAAAFPKTEVEAKAADALKERAEPATRQLTEAAKEIASDLKDEASRAGQQVAQTASQAATDVKETAKETAKDTVAETKEELRQPAGTGSTTPPAPGSIA